MPAEGCSTSPGPQTLHGPLVLSLGAGPAVERAAWLNGSSDHEVPTVVNTEILLGLHRPNFDVRVLPGVDHGLFENASGLVPDEARATRRGRSAFGW